MTLVQFPVSLCVIDWLKAVLALQVARVNDQNLIELAFYFYPPLTVFTYDIPSLKPSPSRLFSSSHIPNHHGRHLVSCLPVSQLLTQSKNPRLQGLFLITAFSKLAFQFAVANVNNTSKDSPNYLKTVVLWILRKDDKDADDTALLASEGLEPVPETLCSQAFQ